MPQGRWRLRVLLFLAVGLGATGLWLVAYGTAIFRELDLDTVDGRFSVRGEKDRPTNLAVVSIDDVTFSDLDRYPLPRSFHGRVIRRLKADGAKLIAYDIQSASRPRSRRTTSSWTRLMRRGMSSSRPRR